MEELQNAVRVAFATTYAFLLKAQNFHWNVRGPDFLGYHELFGKIYESVDDDLDEFAEQVRSMMTLVPASFTELTGLSLIEESATDIDCKQMLYELYKANGVMHKVLSKAYILAEQEYEFGLCDELADRMEDHRKYGWMLRSSMETEM